jgi:hypothetical protein
MFDRPHFKFDLLDQMVSFNFELEFWYHKLFQNFKKES